MRLVVVAQYKRHLIPKKVLERAFGECLALPRSLPAPESEKLGEIAVAEKETQRSGGSEK